MLTQRTNVKSDVSVNHSQSRDISKLKGHKNTESSKNKKTVKFFD